MRKFFQKKIKLKKIAIISLLIFLALGIFSQKTLGRNTGNSFLSLKNVKNYFQKVNSLLLPKSVGDLKISEIDFNSDGSFILDSVKNFKKIEDASVIKREDLSRMIVRDMIVSDLPAVIEMHNKGFKKGVWCDLPYKTSVWTTLNEYRKWIKQYGKENVYVRIGEIDGKIVTAMGGVEDNGKAFNTFTFFDIDIPQKLWSEVLIRISLNFFELARDLNLDIVEAKIERGVWIEGFMRDVIKAKSLPKGIWRVDRDFNLDRKWTQEEFAYDNDSIEKREKLKLSSSDEKNKKQEEGKMLIDKTEETETYQKENGVRELLIYPSPVNINIDGKWVKIKDYLEEKEEMIEDKLIENKKYQLKPFEVFAGLGEKKENLIEYKNNESLISFSLENISYEDKKKKIVLAEANSEMIVHSYKSAIFKNIFEKVDLKYKATVNGIKEELIFNDAKILNDIESPDYFNGKVIVRTKIKVSPDISFKMHNDQIYFEKNGDCIFSTSQPFIYDQEERKIKVESRLIKENEITYLEVLLDYGWMISEEKKYPLVLDPDLNINPAADVNLCTEASCVAPSRAFIKFNISSIPSGATIQSASVTLTHQSNLPINTIAKRFINQTWTESSTVGTFTGTNFGNVLSNVYTGSGPTETWNVLGSVSDGLLVDYNASNTYFTVMIMENVTPATAGYVENSNILSLYLNSKDSTRDSYYSREGVSPPVLNVTYILCGDSICSSGETAVSCPADCATPLTSNSANSTIFDYDSHPLSAKSILDALGTTKTNFRN